MSRLFGTDGVRGLANGQITAELALKLATAAAQVLTPQSSQARPLAVVGRDTRVSGEFLEAAVVAGLAGAGMDVQVVGVVPTPGVAFLTDALDADLGVMLSASHNAMPDNGIKFFNRGGHKLADEVEDLIEAQMELFAPLPTGDAVGRVEDGSHHRSRYLEHLLGAAPYSLSGLKLVVDCANGAASEIGPEVYRRLGAHVVAIHASPDGYNINAGCGSTHLEDLQHAVVEHGADFGIAHDGDADRFLAIAADGGVIDGDQILAVLSLWMKQQGTLVNDTVVATVMSNLGFNLAMAAEGVNVVATAVGDRYVLEEMRQHGYSLGGEQSGHVIMSKYATTGDGILTALMLAGVVAHSGTSLRELTSVMTVLPQVLINVGNVDKAALESNAAIAAEVAAVSAELANRGRVLLRKSGTEPLVRVMVEAEDDATAQVQAARLAEVVRREISLS